jgi:hypothetical protein
MDHLIIIYKMIVLLETFHTMVFLNFQMGQFTMVNGKYIFIYNYIDIRYKIF